MRLFRHRHKPFARSLHLTWLWLLAIAAFTPWILLIVLTTLLLGTAVFAVARPGDQVQRYYAYLLWASLTITSFMDAMWWLSGTA